jgi:phosphoadenosine phosphosulfate reductase
METTAQTTAPDLGTLSVPDSIDAWQPSDIVKWAADQLGATQLVVTASFEDAVLVHVAATAVPGIEIVLLDTQYLFAETQWLADGLRKRLDLNLRIVRPLENVVPDDLWKTDTAGCCQVRKVEPLSRAIAGKRGWVTGIRRLDGPTRASTPAVLFDPIRNIVKVNPLVAFTDDDMSLYVSLHELPVNPLSERGYPSIGCWPCTRPVAEGEDKRAGRWSGSAKTECGLHG